MKYVLFKIKIILYSNVFYLKKYENFLTLKNIND